MQPGNVTLSLIHSSQSCDAIVRRNVYALLNCPNVNFIFQYAHHCFSFRNSIGLMSGEYGGSQCASMPVCLSS